MLLGLGLHDCCCRRHGLPAAASTKESEQFAPTTSSAAAAGGGGGQFHLLPLPSPLAFRPAILLDGRGGCGGGSSSSSSSICHRPRGFLGGSGGNGRSNLNIPCKWLLAEHYLVFWECWWYFLLQLMMMMSRLHILQLQWRDVFCCSPCAMLTNCAPSLSPTSTMWQFP